jgi:hypothetical protein
MYIRLDWFINFGYMAGLNLAPAGNPTPAVQTVARRYPDSLNQVVHIVTTGL